MAGPASVVLPSLVPVFHGWIQKQAVPGHLLIDVHDYSHIHNGPGILLVGHEGNFSMDMDGGEPGLFYYRKQPLGGGPEVHLASALKTALHGCELLEDEPGLNSLRFRTDELLVIASDRLHAPNDGATFSEFQAVLASVFGSLSGNTNPTFKHVSANPKERFAVRVETGQTAGAKVLLDRMNRA